MFERKKKLYFQVTLTHVYVLKLDQTAPTDINPLVEVKGVIIEVKLGRSSVRVLVGEPASVVRSVIIKRPTLEGVFEETEASAFLD